MLNAKVTVIDSRHRRHSFQACAQNHLALSHALERSFPGHQYASVIINRASMAQAANDVRSGSAA